MPDLPSGAVTFLFTDIEGSTRLVKQLRERYGEVLADHQRLLRAAFAAHRGHEIDTQGDSFFVAFASARDALLAAVEGQVALLSYAWPEGVQIKVRMGLHTGQAVVTGGRYTGLAVHRAARIGAAGHGGQILVSQAAQTLLEDEEEDLHIFLRDLGEQRLKDLDRPVRLYEAAGDGLPASFPPLRHEAEPASVAEAAIGPPLWRRPVVLAGAALAVAALVAGAAFLATRDSTGGLVAVPPNSLAAIDPKTNDVVAAVPVGIRPASVLFAHGALWVANLGDDTVLRIDPTTKRVIKTIATGTAPGGLVGTPDAVWAIGADGVVLRIDPEVNEVVARIPTVKVGSLAGGSAAGVSVAAMGTAVWDVSGGHFSVPRSSASILRRTWPGRSSRPATPRRRLRLASATSG